MRYRLSPTVTKAFRIVSPFLAALAALAGLGACPGPSRQSVSDADLAAGRVNMTAGHALVTAAVGDVQAGEGAAFRAIAAGELLNASETVKTGEGSSCDLQLGRSTIVRVRERTELRLDRLASGADLRLAAGTVLCKVEKLAGGDRFRVRTATAACGVKGTEFAVTVEPGGATRLAVRAGRVAFQPAPDRLDELREKAGGIDRKLAGVLDGFESAAPIIEAGRGASVTAEHAARALAKTAAALDKLAGKTAAAAADEAALEEAVRADGAEAARSETPAPLVAADQRLLKEIDALETVPVETGAGNGDAATPTSPRKLVRIDVNPDPPDAEAYLNGEFIGRGSFQAIVPAGERLELRFKRVGYNDRDWALPADADGRQTYAVVLEKAAAAEAAPSPADGGAKSVTSPVESSVLWQGFEGDNDWRTAYEIWGDAGGRTSADLAKVSGDFSTQGKKSLEVFFTMMKNLTAATVGTEKVDLDWPSYKAILVDVKNESVHTIWIAAVLQVGEPSWGWYQAGEPTIEAGSTVTLRFDLDRFRLRSSTKAPPGGYPDRISDYGQLKRFLICFGVTDGPGFSGAIFIDNVRLVKKN